MSLKKYIIVPDSAHGTNPATAAIAGYEIISVNSDKNGVMDIKDLKEKYANIHGIIPVLLWR